MTGKTPNNSIILQINPSDTLMLYYLMLSLIIGALEPLRLHHTHFHVSVLFYFFFVKAAALPDLSSAAPREQWAVMDRKVMKPPFADSV